MVFEKPARTRDKKHKPRRGPTADSDLDVLIESVGYKSLGTRQKAFVDRRLEQIRSDFKRDTGIDLNFTGLENYSTHRAEISRNSPLLNLF